MSHVIEVPFLALRHRLKNTPRKPPALKRDNHGNEDAISVNQVNLVELGYILVSLQDTSRDGNDQKRTANAAVTKKARVPEIVVHPDRSLQIPRWNNGGLECVEQVSQGNSNTLDGDNDNRHLGFWRFRCGRVSLH